MSIDYIVSSLPALVFGQPAPMTWERFADVAGVSSTKLGEMPFMQREWQDLETQLRNAMAEARGGMRYKRPTSGCSLYWKNRIIACFQEKDVARREEFLDRVWWDAAGELTTPSSPLGKGSLATYAVRLMILLKRSAISQENGNLAFDKLTAETRTSF